MNGTTKCIILLIFAMIMIAGCSSVDRTKETTQEVQQEVKAKQLSLDEFTEEAVKLRTDFLEAMAAFGEVRQNTDMEPKAWRTASQEKINEVRTLLKEYQAIAPPDSHEQIGDELNIAVMEFKKGLDLLEEAMNNGDSDKDMEGLEHVQTGQDYWNHAYRLLAIDNPIPPAQGGDGTIDTDDLKDLDKSAGIDRDSVLLNVSENGQELVGQWGFHNEDETANVSIVLNEDGSYEGYGNGDYPSKDNALIGTWEWNYIKGVLYFHHDYAYQDGEKQKANRAIMPMELQRFDDKGIQLFDLESMSTYSYKKMETDEKDK